MRLKLGLGGVVVAAMVGCGGLVAPTEDGADSGDFSADSGGAADAGFADAQTREPDANRPPPPPFDASVDVTPPPFDAGFDVAKTPWDRMEPHAGVVLSSAPIVAVYFGEAKVNGADSRDDFLTWLVSSKYWATMKQYGVGPGTFVGSVRLDPSVLHVPPNPEPGMITADDLALDVNDLLHPSPDGGVDAGASAIPAGDAYVFFLPDGLNVVVDAGGGTLWHSCVEFGGYHDIDTSGDPYAILPPCSFGRGGLAISHEVVEMVTDPNPSTGWYSDADVDNAGGEIGDLCNNPVTVEGWSVTQLWSNADGDCEPPF